MLNFARKMDDIFISVRLSKKLYINLIINE